MREYLFKAQDYDGKWVEGHYYSQVYHKNTIEEEWYHFIKPIGSESWENIRIKPNTLCQYTGLLDVNGNRIWENDICDRKEQFPEIVRYHEGDWTLDYSYAYQKEYGFNFCNLGFYVCERGGVEVIGNVFDNPELVEGIKNE